jgi:hypothetical protein
MTRILASHRTLSLFLLRARAPSRPAAPSRDRRPFPRRVRGRAAPPRVYLAPTTMTQASSTSTCITGFFFFICTSIELHSRTRERRSLCRRRRRWREGCNKCISEMTCAARERGQPKKKRREKEKNGDATVYGCRACGPEAIELSRLNRAPLQNPAIEWDNWDGQGWGEGWGGQGESEPRSSVQPSRICADSSMIEP